MTIVVAIDRHDLTEKNSYKIEVVATKFIEGWRDPIGTRLKAAGIVDRAAACSNGTAQVWESTPSENGGGRSLVDACHEQSLVTKHR